MYRNELRKEDVSFDWDVHIPEDFLHSMVSNAHQQEDMLWMSVLALINHLRSGFFHSRLTTSVNDLTISSYNNI